jgi:hypothetical protein
MLAYIGVFGGHDGPLEAEYCSEGLLQHILDETQDCVRFKMTVAIDGTRDESPLDAGIVNAFYRAHARFAAD